MIKMGKNDGIKTAAKVVSTCHPMGCTFGLSMSKAKTVAAFSTRRYIRMSFTNISLSFPALYHLFQPVAVARGRSDGINKLLVVARGGIAAAHKLAVFGGVGHLVVILYDKQLCQSVPTLHHTVGICDALAVEVVHAVGRCEVLNGLKHAVLVSKVIVLQLALRITQVANHH